MAYQTCHRPYNTNKFNSSPDKIDQICVGGQKEMKPPKSKKKDTVTTTVVTQVKNVVKSISKQVGAKAMMHGDHLQEKLVLKVGCTP